MLPGSFAPYCIIAKMQAPVTNGKVKLKEYKGRKPFAGLLNFLDPNQARDQKAGKPRWTLCKAVED